MSGSRWLKWHPRDEKGSDLAKAKPPKPSEPTFVGFAGSTSEQVPSYPAERPDYDPVQWSEDFEKWKSDNCAHREGKDDWGGVATLFKDFSAWCLLHNSVPCARSTFAWLLQKSGFHCELGFVSGLVIRADLEDVLARQNSLP